MSAKNIRCKITLEASVLQDVRSLAGKKKQPVSSVVQNLVLEELERREDAYFSQLADIRYSLESEVISHE